MEKTETKEISKDINNESELNFLEKQLLEFVKDLRSKQDFNDQIANAYHQNLGKISYLTDKIKELQEKILKLKGN